MQIGQGSFWILVPALPLNHLEQVSALLGLCFLIYKMGTVMPSLWGCCEDEVIFVKKPRALTGTG